MGIFDHSSRGAFVRSHTDVGRDGPALSLHSNSSQRCSTCTVMLEQEGAIPKLFPQSWEHGIVQHLLVCWSIQSSFHWKYGAKSSSWKTTPHHNRPSTKHYTWHNAVRQVPFSWQPPNPDSSIGLPDGEAQFVTPENESPLLKNPVAACFTPLHLTFCIALADVWLGCSCSAMENPFHEALYALFMILSEGDMKFGGL